VILAVSCFRPAKHYQESHVAMICSRSMNQMEFTHLFELVEKRFWAVLILVTFLNPCRAQPVRLLSG
jgi:hypothetical protein